MKKELEAIGKLSQADESGRSSALFCGAADPETNKRLHLPAATANQKSDRLPDLDAVRSIM